MIAPDVFIHDLEPEGFGLICGLAESGRGRSPRVLSVLHDAGRVVRVTDSEHGEVEAHRESFEDAAVRAAELLQVSDADRVVLYDRSRLDRLAAALSAVPATELTQQEVFWENADRFWSSPAIATAPAPPAQPWRRFAALLRDTPDGWAILALYDGNSCAATLFARIAAGVIVEITSLDCLDGTPRPTRENAASIASAVEGELGSVRIGLACDLGAMAKALADLDPVAAVLRLGRSGAVWSHGLAVLA